MEDWDERTVGIEGSWGTDMATIRRFAQTMGVSTGLASYGTINYRYRDYEPILPALNLLPTPSNQHLFIKRLTFANVSFAQEHGRDLRKMSLPHLEELSLLGCGQMRVFFLVLSMPILGLRLKSFSCGNPRKETDDEGTESIEEFLSKISGLKTLSLHSTLPGRWI
jgi:hypothetical protein